jgi:hypothetical protein
VNDAEMAGRMTEKVITSCGGENMISFGALAFVADQITFIVKESSSIRANDELNE